MKAHPYADLFPMMTADELDALAADIKEHGLRHPVVRYKGEVLDGRNRLLACERAGVEPTFTDHDGDDVSALALVLSLNVQRRDLTAAQRSIVAARVWEPHANNHGGDRRSSAQAVHLKRDDVARVFKVGVNAVQQAKAILAEASDLAEQVESCALPLAAAWTQLQDRRKKAAQRAKDLQRAARYAQAVRDGEMTLEEALKQTAEEEREEKERAAAEADSRRTWLKGLADAVGWVEHFVGQLNDDYLGWFTEPNSPGLYDHGVTAERVQVAITQLERVRDITFRSR